MVRDAASPPPRSTRPPDEHTAADGSGWPAADSAVVALILFTTWAARTGRVLRDVPVSELTADELVEFWADDQLEEPYTRLSDLLVRAAAG